MIFVVGILNDKSCKRVLGFILCHMSAHACERTGQVWSNGRR